jgi:hypothetical protein
VLLVLVGSDLTMMEALNTHGRAFFQRGTEMVVPPLSPTETAAIVGSASAADAFDAHLVTGGLPLICNEWDQSVPMWDFSHCGAEIFWPTDIKSHDVLILGHADKAVQQSVF